jgi:hypothetical protein
LDNVSNSGRIRVERSRPKSSAICAWSNQTVFFGGSNDLHVLHYPQISQIFAD